MHIPVLKNEVLKYLDLKPNENIIDGTVGQGGHTLLILEKTKPEGRVLGIDQDAAQIENSKSLTQSLKQRIILVNDSYTNVKEIAEREDFKPVEGILLDLGYSSWQLEQANKGFSFQKDELLDMRYNLQTTITAAQIVNEYSEAEIQKILEEYGEESFARKIAKKIVEARKIKKIESTFELVKIIGQAIPAGMHRGRIHYATKTFQALRIAVNDELGALAKVLPDAVSILSPGGRLVVISFHSLEDRIVKQFFRDMAQQSVVNIVTAKPIMASDQEVLENPRSRSAKLRAIIKI